MMKGQIQEELNNVDNAREAYKQGVSVWEIRSFFRYVREDIILIDRIYARLVAIFISEIMKSETGPCEVLD